MDLKRYYARIREIEAGIHEECAVIVSRSTAEGGRAGVKNEVPRGVAAKLIAEEKADLANDEEAAEYRAMVEKKWKG